MRAVRSKDTKIELLLRKALWRKGHRYRKNYSGVIGKPDIAFPKHKLAVFCDSEFWHGFEWDKRKTDIKSNKVFWVKKIESNIRRDVFVNQSLKNLGWKVLRFWEKEIYRNLDDCVTKVDQEVSSENNNSFVRDF